MSTDMEKLTKTRIKRALMLKERKDRHKRIQNMFQMSELDYNNHQFEYGMKFLGLVFEADPELGKEIHKHKSFWVWWIKEWNRWEAEYLEFIDEHQPVVTFKDWCDEMDSLAGHYLTHQGFKNHLKLFHNVRL